MQITLYTEPTAFEILADEWQELMGRAVNAPIFMTVDYQKIWWHHLGRGQLRLLTFRDENSGRLVGLAPLFVDDEELHFVGCVDVSDYLDFLVDRDYCAEVYEALIDFIEPGLQADWDTAYFCSLAQHSPTHEIMVELAQKKGWKVHVEVEEVCPVITLSETWEDYLAGIDKKQRHEIRRKLRRAEMGAETRWFVIDQAEDLTADILDTFIDLHQKSTPDKEQFWNEAMENFFRALVRRTAELGWLKLYFVEIDGQIAATLLCFDYNDEILVYNSGFDPNKFGHLSPGNIIVSYSIQHAIDLGRKRYDFLRGDEIYKFRFGAVSEPVFRVLIERD
jgi:CelD/BcsL family acetyltransferase involved in cellulose biosynthesis